MFYSHDILTSRKYGVATIWLVATLGSKSNLKKVSRKAILDVDVRKACETILTPEAPMALRLQSNLLYGVTRVYSQQCGYVLNDVETARNSMRALFNAMQTAGLEPEGAHQARAEQLILRSDPNFLPGLDLVPTGLDDPVLAIPLAGDSQLSFLSPYSSQVFSSSSHDIGGIIIPPSQSPSLVQSVSRADTSRFPDEPRAGRGLGSTRLLDDDLGLIIEPDGTVRMGDFSPSQPTRATGLVIPTSAAERAQGEDMIGGQDQLYNLDGVTIQADDAAPTVPQDENMPASDPADADFPQSTREALQQESTSETAQASIRRRPHQRKKMRLDSTTELHTSDLARWSADYLSDMKKATRLKDMNKLSMIAKKNATFWVLGPIDDHEDAEPLSLFTGARLLEALCGLQLRPRRQKRRHEEDDVTTPEARRVRARDETLQDEAGRGVAGSMYQDDFMMPMDDTIERGRNAPTPIDDRNVSNIFPWNQSASSRRPSNIPSSGSLATAAGRQLSMLGRRGSRMTSASPLLGQGALGGEEMEDLQYPDLAIPSSNDGDFSMFGPLAQDDTQITGLSEWQRAAPDGEGMNFLAFVQNFIDEANLDRQQQLATDEGDPDSITDTVEFEALLPPEKNTIIVAAQALMHVLTLGTKGRLHVQQTESFGPIVLGVNTAA